MMRDLKFRLRIKWADTGCGESISFSYVDFPKLLSTQFLGEILSVDEFTGLQDSRGKDIFEGDVVSGLWYDLPERRTMRVEWHDLLGGFTIGGYPLNIHGLYDIEIIDNIHENPGLIKD